MVKLLIGVIDKGGNKLKIRYLIVTDFRGHLIVRKWKRHISRDLNFAIWQKSRDNENLFSRKMRIHIDSF